MKHAHHGHHKKHKHQIPPHVTAFIVAHINGVRAVSRKYNIPVSIILAQGALESGWGLKVVGNAFFGVKGKAPDGGSVSITTHEQF
jgi:flagellum-specific peptidoglycan hydrolase FlgJ